MDDMVIAKNTQELLFELEGMEGRIIIEATVTEYLSGDIAISTKVGEEPENTRLTSRGNSKIVEKRY